MELPTLICTAIGRISKAENTNYSPTKRRMVLVHDRITTRGFHFEEWVQIQGYPEKERLSCSFEEDDCVAQIIAFVVFGKAVTPSIISRGQKILRILLY